MKVCDDTYEYLYFTTRVYCCSIFHDRKNLLNLLGVLNVTNWTSVTCHDLANNTLHS